MSFRIFICGFGNWTDYAGVSTAAKIADMHETASLSRASAGVEASADLAFGGRKAVAK